MSNTPATPPATVPAAPPVAIPATSTPSLEQYRIEQLEKALEKLEGKQSTLEEKTTQRLDDSLSKQASMYSSYVSYITVELGLLSLFVAAIGLWGIRSLKKVAHKKLDDWVKEKSSEYEKKFDDLYEQLAAQSDVQEKQSKEIEAVKVYEEAKRAQSEQNNSEALKLFSRAIELMPEYAEAYAERGIIKVGFRQFSEALSDIENAIHLKPSLANAYYYRAVTLKLSNQNDEEVISALEQAIHFNSFYIKILQEQNNPSTTFYYLRDDPRFKKLVGLE